MNINFLYVEHMFKNLCLHMSNNFKFFNVSLPVKASQIFNEKKEKEVKLRYLQNVTDI